MIEYKWYPVTIADINDIIAATEQLRSEVNDFTKPDANVYARNLTLTAVKQFYNPLSHFLILARDTEHKLLAYTWADHASPALWSDEPAVMIHIAHVEPHLPSKLKIRLVKDMLDLWEGWTRHCGVDIISSNTIRKEQSAYLKLHERAGYTVRGSYAYKRLSTT